MIVEIDNFNYIKIDEKENINLTHYNIYSPLKKLEYYLDFIRNLVFKSCKTNKFIKKNELEHLVYNAFLYFLTNWDNLYHSNQIPFYTWYNFKEIVDNILKSEGDITFIINQKYVNINYFERYLRNFTNNIELKNKNVVMDYIMENFQGYFIMLYFLIRKMIMNKKNNSKCDILFITDYTRYYGNNRFFGTHLFNDNKFKELLKDFNISLTDENYSILFTKYNYINLSKYIRDYYKKDSNYLFIEDILNLKLGFKLLNTTAKFYKKVNLDEYSDEHEKFICNMFNIFLKHKLPFLLWFYLSIKNYFSKNKVKYIIGDSEKNFMFYIYNIYAQWENNIKTIAFSHEVIINNYIHIPISKKYNCVPNCKLVWNENIKKLLINRYNFPNDKVRVFPDPRFLYWKKYPKKEKTILFISQGYPEFYNDIFNTFENKELIDNLIKNGYSFYFKPHPGEFVYDVARNYLNKLKNDIKEIKIINELDFIPEYSIGMSSTMIYELLNAGSKVYILDRVAKEVFMMNDDEFKRYFRENLKEIFFEILDK